MLRHLSSALLFLTVIGVSPLAALGQQPLREFKGAEGAIRNLAISADGKQVVAGPFAPKVQVWDLETGAATHDLKSGGVTIATAFAPDGKSLAVGSLKDGTVRLFDLETKQEIKVVTRHNGGVHHLAFSPDGKWIASAASGDGSVRCTDIMTGKQVAAWNHTAGANTVAFSPDGKWIASCGDDRSVRVWNVAAGKFERALTGHNDTVAGLAFSRDGTLLYSGSRDGVIREFEIAGGKRLRKWTTGRGQARTLALSLDGRSLAVATDKGEAQIWELATLMKRRAFPADKGFNWTVAFTPDGKGLATAGDEVVVRLWDVTGGFRTANDPKASPFPDKELTAYWDALAGGDASAAYTAIWALASQPGLSVPFVARQVKGDKKEGAEAARFVQLIKQLDDAKFVERERAARELAAAGLVAREAMVKALKEDISDEQRRRLERLVDKLGEVTLTPEEIRRSRLVELLARIDSPEAKRLLKEVGGGN